MKQHKETSRKRNFWKHSENRKRQRKAHHQRKALGWGDRKSAKTKRAVNLLEALMVQVMTCPYLFLFCTHWRFTWILRYFHSPLSMPSIKWKRSCTFLLVAFPTIVFATLPLSSTLPHAGFLFSLIFSSASPLALSAVLGSTYNICLSSLSSPHLF